MKSNSWSKWIQKTLKYHQDEVLVFDSPFMTNPELPEVKRSGEHRIFPLKRLCWHSRRASVASKCQEVTIKSGVKKKKIIGTGVVGGDSRAALSLQTFFFFELSFAAWWLNFKLTATNGSAWLPGNWKWFRKKKKKKMEAWDSTEFIQCLEKQFQSC